MYGPQIEYSMLEPHDASAENFLVLGPWRHGYWSSSLRQLGNLDYGEAIGKEFRAGIEAKFFAHYLKTSRAQIPRASTSETRPALRPVLTRGSITVIFRRASPGQRVCICRTGLAELDRLNRRGHYKLCERPRQSDPL